MVLCSVCAVQKDKFFSCRKNVFSERLLSYKASGKLFSFMLHRIHNFAGKCWDEHERRHYNCHYYSAINVLKRATSCCRRWPAQSASSAVSKYQPPSRAANQAVYCWQPCLSGCRSSSLERSARGRRFIVIIADFPPSIKNSSFSTYIPSPDFLTVWLASLQWSL